MLFFQPWVARFQRETARNTVFPNPTRILHHETRRVGRGGGGGRMNCWKRSHASRMGRLCYAEWNMCRSVGSGWWWWSCCGRIEISTCYKFWRSGLEKARKFCKREEWGGGKYEDVARKGLWFLEFVFGNFNSNLWSWEEVGKFEDVFKFNDCIFGWKFQFKSSIIRYNKLILKCGMNKV